MNNPDGFRVLCGPADPALAAAAPPLPPFAPQAVEFLAALSAALLKDPSARAYPEVVSFAFFCRRANLQAMRASYDDLSLRLGRGLAFHIAPGNVPMNFAYSLVSALLAGNASIVKAPSKAFAQVAVTCAAMQTLLREGFQPLLPYASVIEYSRDRQDLTAHFSALCDVRILWGGDDTIRRVRRAELNPRAFDVPFADRWSLAVLNADAVLRMDNAALTALAVGFYNDTYLYDQNACTAPRLCVWLGEPQALETAKSKFWNAVHREAAARYQLSALTAVDKQTELFRAAVLLDGARREPAGDMLLQRIHVDALTPECMNIHCTGGCFLEYDAAGLAELLPVLTPRTQTLACAGLDTNEVRSFLLSAGAKGVDRVVPVGHTLDFSLVWDGYDLIRTLSRKLI